MTYVLTYTSGLCRVARALSSSVCLRLPQPFRATSPLCFFLGLNLTEKLRWTMIADDAAEFLGQCCTEEKPLGGLRWSLAQDVHDQPQFGLYTQR